MNKKDDFNSGVHERIAQALYYVGTDQEGKAWEAINLYDDTEIKLEKEVEDALRKQVASVFSYNVPDEFSYDNPVSVEEKEES